MFSDKRTESIAATQIIPGAISDSIFASGLIDKGKRDIVTIKNNRGLISPEGFRIYIFNSLKKVER